MVNYIVTSNNEQALYVTTMYNNGSKSLYNPVFTYEIPRDASITKVFIPTKIPSGIIKIQFLDSNGKLIKELDRPISNYSLVEFNPPISGGSTFSMVLNGTFNLLDKISAGTNDGTYSQSLVFVGILPSGVGFCNILNYKINNVTSDTSDTDANKVTVENTAAATNPTIKTA